MCSHAVRGKGGRKRWREIRRALLLDRALRQELSLERVRDLLLGRALRKLRDTKRFDKLGSACWSDYVGERLGCELRWAQYLVRVDLVLERFPELRTAAVNERSRTQHRASSRLRRAARAPYDRAGYLGSRPCSRRAPRSSRLSERSGG